MTISPEALSLLEEEQRTLTNVLDSLRSQLQKGNQRLANESQRASRLTAELVASKRVEDRAMLASDEAVSHGLKDQKQDELSTLKKIISKPYFARMILREDNARGTQEIEYKLGFAANTECRIIDWRKAPISKLYYDYKEGDEYSEEIQGREREGKIILRNSVEIEREQLRRVNCRYGEFLKDGPTWKALGQHSSKGKASGLPHILSLITPEQFRTITEDATSAVLIQGVAGSGKTTVAMHRLAWLLHEENSALRPEEAVVLTFSAALKRYVSNMLPSIEVHGVDILTFEEWAARSVALTCPHLLDERGCFVRPIVRAGSGIERVKRSYAVLKAVEEVAERQRANAGNLPEDILISALNDPKAILAHDETHLLDRELILAAQRRAMENKQQHCVDYCDDALLVRITQILRGGLCLKNGSTGQYRHIVADEVQDMSAAELASVIGAVENSSNLTLVGDTAQKTSDASSFPGWEKLRRQSSLKEAMSSYVTLSVSHRSTLPIMQLADHVQRREHVTQGRQGRVPIWFLCKDEEQGTQAAIDWLTKALERFPDALTAVICASPDEARYVHNLLKNSFRSGLRLGTEKDFSFDQGIVVTDAVQVKGLEFFNVLIWNPSAKAYPAQEQSRNLLYIAISRAEENLSLISWGASSPCLPRFGSKLLRNHDLRPNFEEEDDTPRDSLGLDRVPQD